MRIPSGQKNLLAFALVAGAGFIATLYLMPTTSSPGSADAAGAEAVAPDVPDSSELSQPVEDVGPETVPLDSAAENDFRGYALPLTEVRGLSPETPGGTRVELWVAWDPPITKQPRVQRLLSGAIVETMVPAAVPEGPVTVQLLIPVKDFPDFVFAHRYGSLSAAVIP